MECCRLGSESTKDEVPASSPTVARPPPTPAVCPRLGLPLSKHSNCRTIFRTPAHCTARYSNTRYLTAVRVAADGIRLSVGTVPFLFQRWHYLPGRRLRFWCLTGAHSPNKAAARIQHEKCCRQNDDGKRLLHVKGAKRVRLSQVCCTLRTAESTT